MKADHAIRAELVALLRDGYRRPSQIATDELGIAYLSDLAATFVAMNPTDFEWEHVKGEFMRSWAKPHWPLASEFPRRLGAFRARQADQARAADYVTKRAEADARAVPYHHGEYLAACNRSSFMATSPDPKEARWGKLLCDLARILTETRDDNDLPRDPRRRRMEMAE